MPDGGADRKEIDLRIVSFGFRIREDVTHFFSFLNFGLRAVKRWKFGPISNGFEAKDGGKEIIQSEK